MKKFKTLSEPMQIAFIGAISVIIASIVGALIGGIFLLKSSPPASTSTAITTILASPTPSRRDTYTATATMQLTQLAPYGGRLELDDPLQKNSVGRWDSNAGCRFIANAYQINSTNYYHECAENGDHFSNIACQVKIVLIRGSVGGIEFRRSDTNNSYYSFSVGWNGQYELQRINSQQNVTRDVPGRILPNDEQAYVLGIVMDKSLFQFYINGIVVLSLTDSTYTDGSLFLFVNGSEVEGRTPMTQAIFSDLKIWEL